LIVGTFLTLMIIPGMYMLLSGVFKRIREWVR
jgi:hypothetical protein